MRPSDGGNPYSGTPRGGSVPGEAGALSPVARRVLADGVEEPLDSGWIEFECEGGEIALHLVRAWAAPLEDDVRPGLGEYNGVSAPMHRGSRRWKLRLSVPTHRHAR